MKLPPIRLLTTKADVLAFLSRIYPNNSPAPGWEEVAFDTEFSIEDAPPNSVMGAPKQRAFMAYMQLSQGTERVVIEGPLTSNAKGKKRDLLALFRRWLADPKVKKLVSTTRADFRVLKDAGYGEVRGIVQDTEVTDWLYDENRMFHGLKDGASDHCGIYMEDYGKVFGFHGLTKGGARAKKKTIPSMREVVEGREGGHDVPWTGKEGRAKAVPYAALDPYATHQLAAFHRRELKKRGLWKWYRQVERPLTMTLIRMEDRGIRIDADAVDRIRQEVYAEILRLEAVVRAATDEPTLNLRSNPQMQKLIFEKLKWPVIERNELTDAQEANGQDEGNPSIAKWVLDEYEKLGYALATHLKAHRNKATLHNVFLVNALVKRDRRTSLIHTIFKQARTKTGRLSSGDRRLGKMNLQNIPARKEKDPYRLRQFFLPTVVGYSLIVADYSQIELYIIAQLSQDPRMLQAFARGEDLHMLTAAKIFKLKLPKDPANWDSASPEYAAWKLACEAWKEKYADQRDSAKIVNFGLNYGMSAYALAANFGMTVAEAETWVEAYFDLYPGVRRFMKRTIAFCRKHGYVKTISGRRRNIPEIYSKDKALLGHAERMAINAPIQGSAADIIKVAMNALELGLRYKCDWIPREALVAAEKAKRLGFVGLLQVHDEIVGQSPPKVAKEVAKLVQFVMESVCPSVFTNVVIKASVGTGPNWNAAKN